MGEVNWTHQALDDLDAIALFIARDAPKVANVFVEKAFELTDKLLSHPKMGRKVPEIGDDSIREVFLFGYRIIYRISGKNLDILTLHHGARLLKINNPNS